VYYWDDPIEEVEIDIACSMYCIDENVYIILIGKLEVKKPLGRPRRRWNDNIKTNFKEI
jgi:hypothetical protein